MRLPLPLAVPVLTLLLSLVLLVPDGLRAAEPVRVLFIGNSYTYYNDLPALVRQMSLDARQPRPLEVRAVTVGGASLQRHWDGPDARAALAGGRWDYVVIQDFSTLPLDDPDTTRAYARRFAEAARQAGARPIFYLTWAREYAPQNQARLDAVYTELARETGGLLAPVGDAWQLALAGTPKPDLYVDDGSHPTYAGSYLAASVFYSLLYGTRPPTPSPEQAARLQGAAASDLQGDAWDSLQATDLTLRTLSTARAW